MTITEKFQNKRCVFSIECFPPKQTTQMDKMKATLQAMRALNPDFISVTFGAGRFRRRRFHRRSGRLYPARGRRARPGPPDLHGQ